MSRKKNENVVIAFEGGILIDGNGNDPIYDSSVLIEDGKIKYAGKRIRPEDICEVYDITGKAIMPGLIDTHLHFSGNLNANAVDWVQEDNYEKCVVAVQQAHDCLESGLTTVGEISRFGIAIRNMVNLGEMEGPRIITSGLGFCATAGHGDSHECTVEMNRERHPWAECADGPWELRKAVRNRIRQNPDAIKIWSTGGGMWRWENGFDQHYCFEEIKAVVDECSMRNIPVWAHCYGDAGPSVRAGCDFIIHGQKIDEASLELMAKQGTMLCPTLYFLPDWFSKYPVKYVPEIHDRLPGNTLLEKEITRSYINIRTAMEKGIILTIGSDSFNNDLTPYGETAIREIITFVENVGFSEMDAVKAATSNGAKALRVYDETGSLEEGKCADILVINGNPLDDIRNLTKEKMDVIMKDGKFVKNTLRV